MFSQTFRWTLLALLTTAVVSFLASYNVLASTVVGLGLVAGTFVVGLKSFPTAVLIVAAELVFGSLGHLFRIQIAGVDIPFRIALFAALMLAWLVQIIKTHCVDLPMQTPGTSVILSRRRRIPFWYALLAIAVGWGIVNGMLRGRDLATLVADVNAYGFLLFLFPLWTALRMRGERLKKDLLQVLLAGTIATAVLTILVLLAFSQHVTFVSHVYTWVRDWGLGEVTRAPGNFYRVFFQSQIWSVLVLLIVSVFLPPLSTSSPQDPPLSIRGEGGVMPSRQKTALILTGGLLFSTILLSFSRSFWLGLLVGAIVLLILLIRRGIRGRRFAVLLGQYALMILLGLAIVLALSQNFIGLAGKRTVALVSEPAAASRWNLLPVLWNTVKRDPILGTGFGTTLTYKTEDPRLLVYFPDGWYTTYAFEWGYLEQWLKMGMLGLVAILGLLISIARKLLRSGDPDWSLLSRKEGRSRAGLFAALVALAVIHGSTPYLNHPLGLGFLILADFFSHE